MHDKAAEESMHAKAAEESMHAKACSLTIMSYRTVTLLHVPYSECLVYCIDILSCKVLVLCFVCMLNLDVNSCDSQCIPAQ